MSQPDQDKLHAFLGKMQGDLGAIATGAAVLMGDRLAADQLRQSPPSGRVKQPQSARRYLLRRLLQLA
jgi:hypothetical protein